VKTEEWMGKYPLCNTNTIRDFNVIIKNRGLVIERGDSEKVCGNVCKANQNTKIFLFF
jgi:hypothetical protein